MSFHGSIYRPPFLILDTSCVEARPVIPMGLGPGPCAALIKEALKKQGEKKEAKSVEERKKAKEEKK